MKKQLHGILIFAFLVIPIGTGVILFFASQQTTELRSRAAYSGPVPTPFVSQSPNMECYYPTGSTRCHSAAEYMRWRALNCNKLNRYCDNAPTVDLNAQQQQFVRDALSKCNAVLMFMGAECKD